MTLAFADKVYNSKSFQRNGLRPYIEKLAAHQDDGQLQVIHTPWLLCEDILRKISEFRNLKNSNILVLYNLEFVYMLLSIIGVKSSRITFAADAKTKFDAAKGLGCNTVNVTCSKKTGVELMPKPKKQFDVIITNPPYEAPKIRKTGAKTGTCGAKLWTLFCRFSKEWAKDGGVICHIHPGQWRKPDSDLFPFFKELNLIHLEIHDIKDGMKCFGVSTGFDWYIVQNSPYQGSTTIKDAEGKITEVDISDMAFLPNSHFDLLQSIMAKPGEPKCEVVYNAATYDHRKPCLNQSKTRLFKYPCVYGLTQKDGLKLLFANDKKGDFWVPKVIIPLSKYTDAFIDMEGEYGQCEFAFGICVKSKREAEGVKKAIMSEEFKKVWAATEWIYNGKEWRTFKSFRRDFWKEFV